jgi:hypothetical protein
MISRTYDIMGQWYQSTFHKLSSILSKRSSMISYMISRCLYPPLKTCLVEHCQSSTLSLFKCMMFKINDCDLAPSLTRLGSSSVSDTSRKAICDVSQSWSVTILGRWAPHQARPIFLLVWQSLLWWTRLHCSALTDWLRLWTWLKLAITRWLF